MGPLELKVQDDVIIVVPANLESVTTYVLLEQEAWFEKEIAFLKAWLRPGMTVIDIGANLGVYSLLLARHVGPKGRVFAYEPGSETRAFLERSRDINRLTNLDVLPFALSDRKQEAFLVFGYTSEENRLGSSGRGETVQVTSLDNEDDVHEWISPDFLKIDAEGEEEKIVAGAREFLRKHSPLVMFEFMVGDKANEKLRSVFQEAGYDIYRTLPEAPFLVPVHRGEKVEYHELNLFAAKADRARLLSSLGFLVEVLSTWSPGKYERTSLISKLKSLDFVSAFPHLFNEAVALHPDYHASLAAYSVWRDPSGLPSDRCSALYFAFTALSSLCEREPTAARLSTLARIAWDWGKRHASLKALEAVLNPALTRKPSISEPFLPASHRFDAIRPVGQPEMWFIASAAELWDRAQGHSSRFTGPTPVTSWLCNQPYATVAMERRRVLIAARAGHRPVVPKILEIETRDNLNASVWRAKKVPGVATV